MLGNEERTDLVAFSFSYYRTGFRVFERLLERLFKPQRHDLYRNHSFVAGGIIHHHHHSLQNKGLSYSLPSVSTWCQCTPPYFIQGYITPSLQLFFFLLSALTFATFRLPVFYYSCPSLVSFMHNMACSSPFLLDCCKTIFNSFFVPLFMLLPSYPSTLHPTFSSHFSSGSFVRRWVSEPYVSIGKIHWLNTFLFIENGRFVRDIALFAKGCAFHTCFLSDFFSVGWVYTNWLS